MASHQEQLDIVVVLQELVIKFFSEKNFTGDHVRRTATHAKNLMDRMKLVNQVPIYSRSYKTQMFCDGLPVDAGSTPPFLHFMLSLYFSSGQTFPHSFSGPDFVLSFLKHPFYLPFVDNKKYVLRSSGETVLMFYARNQKNKDLVMESFKIKPCKEQRVTIDIRDEYPNLQVGQLIRPSRQDYHESDLVDVSEDEEYVAAVADLRGFSDHLNGKPMVDSDDEYSYDESEDQENQPSSGDQLPKSDRLRMVDSDDEYSYEYDDSEDQQSNGNSDSSSDSSDDGDSDDDSSDSSDDGDSDDESSDDGDSDDESSDDDNSNKDDLNPWVKILAEMGFDREVIKTVLLDKKFQTLTEATEYLLTEVETIEKLSPPRSKTPEIDF